MEGGFGGFSSKSCVHNVASRWFWGYILFWTDDLKIVCPQCCLGGFGGSSSSSLNKSKSKSMLPRWFWRD